METASEKNISREERLKILYELANILTTEPFREHILYATDDLFLVISHYQHIANDVDSTKDPVPDFLFFDLHHILTFFKALGKDPKYQEINRHLLYLKRTLFSIKKILNIPFNSGNYNSSEYYEKQIAELKTAAEKAKKEKDKEQKKEIYSIIKNYEDKIESITARQDAEKTQKEKIKNTFTELRDYITPIEEERTRLNRLFYFYIILIGCALGYIIYFESLMCCNIQLIKTTSNFYDYLPFILPIPIAGGILWAAIIQANRAQRQLVIIAKHIHEIEYIEGLLLSIHPLAPNMDDANKRVNEGIDKLIENHFSRERHFGAYNEESISKEEKKDFVPMDLLLKFIKEIKK